MSVLAVVDYGSGNLRSVAKAFERCSRAQNSDVEIVVTDDAKTVAAADRIVLPGVGAFGDCARGVNAVPGLRAALDDAVMARKRPFFGICVGMQLMAEQGLEHGTHQGFGWIKGEIRRMEPVEPDLKIPHMGWNLLHARKPHPVHGPADDLVHAYFVHSYALFDADPAQVLARTTHGLTFPAMVGRDNMIGTQFHPEKSQAFGLAMISDFLHWQPEVR